MGVLALATLCPEQGIAGEAANHFVVYAPPGNQDTGQFSALTITAHSNRTTVEVRDDDADGDDDDSVTATLNEGQSIVVRIADGAVNDDAGGKWDGDVFVVDSTKPVTAMLSTNGQRQHDWAPPGRRGMVGQEFYLWAHSDDWDIDLVAYEDNTVIEIFDIAASPTTTSGLTDVVSGGELVLSQRLDAGQDLLNFFAQSGVDITEAGHSYRIVTSEPVSCLFGSLDGDERDGGGYVPSETGFSVGTHFYFPVPTRSFMNHEREIRVATGDVASQVTVRGWSEATGWIDVGTYTVPSNGHLDLTGIDSTLCKSSTFFELEATEPVNVFAGNFIESGGNDSSDYYTFVSSLGGGKDIGREFITYLGPPGNQSNGADLGERFSHLYLTSPRDNARVTIIDVDTGGSVLDRTYELGPRDTITDVRIDEPTYELLSEGNRPYLRVSSNRPTTVAATNWNDNWLAFVSSGDVADMGLRISMPDVASCGQEFDIDVRVTNLSDDPITGIVYEQSPVGGLTIIGSPVDPGDLQPGERHEQSFRGIIECSEATSGDLVGLKGIAEGTDFEDKSVRSKRTKVIPAYVPDGTGILWVTTRPDTCAVEVRWLTDEDDGNVEYAVLRRQFGSSEPFGEIGRVASLAPAMSGFEYGYRDVSAAQGIRYQYKVSAIDPVEGREVSSSGPAVCDAGEPFTEAPDTTGNLELDFAEVGQIFTDAEADVEHPGMDVDRLAVAYDRYVDSLYLAVSAVGVFGDLDADGDPNTNSRREVSGTVDQPRFGTDEQFAFVLDFDEDGTGDAVVGIPLGGDLDFLQATTANAALVNRSPTLAFQPLTGEQAGQLVVEIINAPSPDKPDLELVVLNVSALNGGQPLDEIGLTFYMHAPSATASLEWAPSEDLRAVADSAAVATDCGSAADQIHLGDFAVFGNVFSGSPRFDFVPLGWEHAETGEVLEPPPPPVSGQVIASPTAFTAGNQVDLRGSLHPSGLALSEQDMLVRESARMVEGNYKITTEMEWNYSGPQADERYENLDVQVFRLITTDCSTTVKAVQRGTAGGLRGNRFIRLANDDVAEIGTTTPANILAHSVLGTFESRGTLRDLRRVRPEDWLETLGPLTAPEFTHYAFLNEQTYPESLGAETIDLFGQDGIALPAGTWYLNYYLWTYANNGLTMIDTTFEPGADCEGSL